MSGDSIFQKSLELLEAAKKQGVVLVTAESCTGGMLAAAITQHAGSSSVFSGGYVTYSNTMKESVLGVPGSILSNHGAVSGQTASAMAAGALRRSPEASLCVAITGIAGPEGGTLDKPVGLVWFGVAKRDGCQGAQKALFSGDRKDVRDAATLHGINLLMNCLKGERLHLGEFTT